MRSILYMVILQLVLWQAFVANGCSDGAIRMTATNIPMISKSHYIAGGLQVCVNTDGLQSVILSGDDLMQSLHVDN